MIAMPLKNFFCNRTFVIFSAVLAALFLSVLFFPVDGIIDYFNYEFRSKNDLKINLSLVNQGVNSLAADSSNRLMLRAEVRDRSGRPVPMARISFSVADGRGSIYAQSSRTDKYGECIASYIPPSTTPGLYEKNAPSATLTAALYGTEISSSISVRLMPVPVVFVHGYQASGAVFENMREYLSSKGFQSAALTYKSEAGVASGAKELESFLAGLRTGYQTKGIQVKRFDIISHSMGGLVVRYYAGSNNYINNNDIRKAIFISVPHQGSHLAPLGMTYFDYKAIRDLVPGSELFSNVFPSTANKGLNNTIQVGNIIGQYDEVVSLESASLAQWNIKTEIFNVGDSNFSVDNLLNGSIMESQNHKAILSNRKVFEKIEEMLKGDLPYPSVR